MKQSCPDSSRPKRQMLHSDFIVSWGNLTMLFHLLVLHNVKLYEENF